jgi:hypothetical protein
VQLQSLGATNDDRGGGHHPTEKDIVEKDSIKVVQRSVPIFVFSLPMVMKTALTTLTFKQKITLKLSAG